jgi:hypothetical protein
MHDSMARSGFVPPIRPGRHRNVSSRSDPLSVALEFHAELVVVHPQISVPAAHDRLRNGLLHFLRDLADIGLVAAIVAEAIEAEAVVEMTEKDDIVLESKVGSSSATATTSATTGAATTAATACP